MCDIFTPDQDGLCARVFGFDEEFIKTLNENGETVFTISPFHHFAFCLL